MGASSVGTAEPLADRVALMSAQRGGKEELCGLINEFRLGVAEQMNDMGIRKADSRILVENERRQRQALQ